MINFGMTVLGQSYETIMDQSPQWIFKQLELEQNKHPDSNKQEVSRKEMLTMMARFRNFDREKELANAGI